MFNGLVFSSHQISRPTDHKEKSNDLPEKTFRTLFFLRDFFGKILRPRDVTVKTVKTSSQTDAVEMFQKAKQLSEQGENDRGLGIKHAPRYKTQT